MASPGLIVKICGLSTPATLDAAIESGADMAGFVFFAPSPRNLTIPQARDLAAQARTRIARAALTVDAEV
jgi:phosphoribosylanthranilate isomerase